MNASEAIGRINDLILTQKMDDEQVHALMFAVDSLQYDVAQKPVRKFSDKFGVRCPRCDNILQTHWLDGRTSYCDECSQAISWKGER